MSKKIKISAILFSTKKIAMLFLKKFVLLCRYFSLNHNEQPKEKPIHFSLHVFFFFF